MSKIVTGEQLSLDFRNLKITRTPLIDELLFERDIFMISADAGAGKSIFALNLIGALSFHSTNLFLGCKVFKSVNILYIQLEGDYEETIERLRFMQDGGMIVDPHKLCIMEEKTLNVMDDSSVAGLFRRLNNSGFIPEVVIIDPIYKLAHGDPSKGEVALAIIRFSDLLYNKFNCTNVLIHHNLKDSYDTTGNKIDKSDSFYGHSFIKNHVRTSYAMKVTGEDNRLLERKKGRGSDTKARIKMVYDPETCLLSLDESDHKRSAGGALDRLVRFIEECKENDKTTTAKEVCQQIDISYDRLRHIKSDPEILKRVDFKKVQPKNREIWCPI